MSSKLFQSDANRVKPSSEFITTSKEVLNELVHVTNGVDGVLLASADGFEVSSIFQKTMTVVNCPQSVVLFWRWCRH